MSRFSRRCKFISFPDTQDIQLSLALVTLGKDRNLARGAGRGSSPKVEHETVRATLNPSVTLGESVRDEEPDRVCERANSDVGAQW
jgi:hypothetical protein